MFDSNSRYAPVDDYEVTDSQGRPVKIKKARFIADTPSSLTRKVVQGDRSDLMAFAYYQDATRFWRIADANEVMDSAELVAEPGDSIQIPPGS